MDLIFSDLPFVVVYVDDILVFSRNHDDHQQHLRQVLSLMAKNGLVARIDKCVFGATQEEFLGHHVSGDGLQPLAGKVSAVKNFPRPTSVKQVQEYTGMLNYYHRFIPNAAEIIAPLYELTSRKKSEFHWSEAHETAFKASKRRAARPPRSSLPGATRH